ncbi:CD44 antigen isoform X9 [Lepidochelys kempii]|uniref:CD44 antigen isoform X9 n=1 Tax=Lepidochelys kempii TaxID=8472 RepID=UPI003C701BB2
MSNFLLCATFGLCLLQLCLAETQFNISCRYAGVFHVEKNRRYNLTRSEAVELCRALNSTLPTMDQMKKAHELGFETCRYGYIEDKIVIPRIKPYSVCAANNTGIYILTSNITDRYDTYCYNASETRDMACEPIIKLNDSWHDNQSRIVIDNADGSRYADGVKQPDPTPVTDDNHVGSGSTYDGDTTNPTIIRIHTAGAPYYEDTTPDATDYSSVSGRKEYHSTSTNDIAIPFDDKRGEDSTMISLITDGVPGKDSDHPSKGQHPTSTTIITADEDSLRGAHHENSTQGQEIPGFIPLQWHSTDHKEEHPTTAIKDVNSHDGGADDEDSTEETLKPMVLPGWDINDVKNEYPTSTNLSSHDDGADGEDSTQDPLIPVISLGGDNSDDKEQHPPSSTVNPDHGAHEETSSQHEGNPSPDIWWWSNTDHKEQHPTTATKDEDSQENETDDEDSLQDPLHSGWDTNDDTEQHPPVTNKDVDSHGDPKRIESTQEPLLHNVYHGGDKDEDKYPTNTTVDNVKPELFPTKERDHSSSSEMVNNEIGLNTSTPTAVVVSNEGAKNEDATEDPFLHNVYLGGDKDEDKYATNTSVDSVKPELFPAKERDHSSSSVTVNNEIGRNTYTPTAAVVSNEGAKNEDATQDPFLHNDYLGVDKDEDKYPTNTTEDSVKSELLPAKERDHSSSSETVNNEIERNTYTPTAVVVSNEGAKNEDATEDPFLHNVYLGGDKDEDKYATNTTLDSVKPELFPAKERDHSSSSVTVNNEIGRNTYTPTAVVVSNEGAKNEDLTQDPLLNGAHSGWSDKVKYSTNATRDDVLPGVIPSRGSEHSTTAVVSNGGTKHEDSTQDPLLRTVHPGWGNADKYPTNVTRDDVLHGIIPPSENDQEKESSHTAVVSNDGATHEGSTQDPLLHSVHPGWGNEDKYLTATSRDDVLPGIIPLSETEHKNESSHTAVVSNDGIKHEDSTKDPLAPSIQPGGDNEDKYPTNNPIDNLIPGVFSDIESGHGRGPASTATSSITNKHGGRRANPSGQVTSPKIASQPRSAQIPEWLIIVASLLALTLILAVCIAVNSRRRCGQKKKLVINNGKGSVSDKKMGGLNGEASKSQEMVHLVHKEQPDNRTGPCDEFLTTDETQNQQEANMKTGM